MREVMLIAHFIGLVMGLGTSFSHAFLDQVISRKPEPEATRFRLDAMVLSKMGYTGIGLLLVSGTYLIIPYWETLPSNPLLIVKLVLVVILCILLTFIGIGTKKAYKGDAAENLKKIEPLGKLTLIIGLTIVILAVFIFH